jgi:hypothetical protein
MKNKMFIVGMVSVLLVFGFVFTACSGDSEDDTWTDITNAEDIEVSDLLGTWKGNTTIRLKAQTIPISDDEDNPLEGVIDGITLSAASIPVDLAIAFPAITDPIGATIKIDLDDILGALAGSPELNAMWADPGFLELLEIPSETPLNKDGLWGLLIAELSEGDTMLDFININSDNKYELVVTAAMSIEELFSASDPEDPEDDPDEPTISPKVEKNQDNTKIKITIPVNDVVTNPIKLDGNAITLTLNKQG